MKTTAKFVRGYWRGGVPPIEEPQTTTTPESVESAPASPNVAPGVVLLSSVMTVIVLAYWQVALGLALVSLVAWGTWKGRHMVRRRPKLVINYYTER